METTNKYIILHDLINDINSSKPDAYLFLRVLNLPDRKQFMTLVNPNDLAEIYNTKKIKFTTWYYIMKKIKLSSDYILFRRAYGGENGGGIQISDEVVKEYVCPLFIFPAHEPENKTCLTKLCGDLFQTSKTKRILLNESTMKEFEYYQPRARKTNNVSQYKLAYWPNHNYKFEIPEYLS